MPIIKPDTPNSSPNSTTKSSSDEFRSSSPSSTGDRNPAKAFFERMDSWLADAGPREQLFVVAMDAVLARKEAIKKATGRDIYQELIQKYKDTVCLVAGGSESLPETDDEDEAMAAALAALIAFGS